MKSQHDRVVLGFGLVFGTVIAALLDASLVGGTIRQLQTIRYRAVPGVITHSRVAVHPNGGATQPDLHYEYRVAGRRLIGTRYHYGEVWTGDGHAQNVVAAHPVGSRVTVYHDPSDPTDSALVAGVPGSQLLILMFVTPHHLALASGWVAVARWLLRRPNAAATADTARSRRALVRIESLGPLGMAVLTVGGLCFLAPFGIFVVWGWHPPRAFMHGLWSVVLIAGATAGLVRGTQLARRAQRSTDSHESPQPSADGRKSI